MKEQDLLKLLERLENLNLSMADNDQLTELDTKLKHEIGHLDVVHRFNRLYPDVYSKFLGFQWKIAQELYRRGVSALDIRQMVMETPDLVEEELTAYDMEELMQSASYFSEMAEQDRSYRVVWRLIRRVIEMRTAGNGKYLLN